jgi:hypothetical protein
MFESVVAALRSGALGGSTGSTLQAVV